MPLKVTFSLLQPRKKYSTEQTMPSSDNATPLNSPAISNKNQSGIQSLEIGLSILDLLIAHNEPMMLKDIAQALQMHPAKSHRYLVSLIRKNYARKLDDGRYGLGARIDALGTLGYRGPKQNNILARLTTAAGDIKDTLNCGVQIAKWFSEGPIIIQSVEPDSPISIITRIGSRMPITTSATGQLFASYQSEALIKPLVVAEWQDKSERLLSFVAQNKASNGAVSNPESLSATDIAAKWQHFTQLQATIRGQGYATVSGDLLIGINAISIPIILPKMASETINEETAIEYAITIIGTAEQLPVEQQHDVIDKVMAIAQRYQIA